MSSNNLSLDSGSLDISSEVLSNKETQTSTAFITDSFNLIKGPSRPLPKGINKSDVEPTINILDYQDIKGPSDTKSLDIANESFVKDIVNSNASNSEDSGSAKSQRYCNEVAKPYLNYHVNDCEDELESLEKVIQDVLDFSDQPCDIEEVNKGLQKILSNISINKMDSLPKIKNQKYCDPKKSNAETNHKKSEDQSTPKSSLTNINQSPTETVCPNKIQLPEDDTDESNENKDPNKSISRESIAKCVKDSVTAIKRSASSCLDKIEIVIGIKKPENPNEKPTYYAIEKSRCNVSHNVQTETGHSLNSLKNLFNNPNEKISTIKETCKDIACKLYKTSNDAVTFLTSESAKLLNKAKKEKKSDDNFNEEQAKSKSFRTVSADSITRFLFQQAGTKPKSDDTSNSESIKGSITGPSRLAESVPPAVKLSLCRLRDNVVSSKFDKSSPYDKPLPKEISNQAPQPTEPRLPTVSAIDHPESAETSNMFAIIKSKIFSIFHDEGEKITEPVIQENPQDDEEEDPFERFMEQ